MRANVAPACSMSIGEDVLHDLVTIVRVPLVFVSLYASLLTTRMSGIESASYIFREVALQNA